MECNQLPENQRHKVKEYYTDQDGFWLILKDGWIDPDMGTRTIHEETRKAVLARLKKAKRVSKI